MSYDKKYFESVISKIFDDEIKKVLSSDELEKFQKINNNTYYIKSFNKSLFETDQESFLENSKLKNSTILHEQLLDKGNVITVIYKNSKPITVDGRWDKIEENILLTKNGPYFGVYKDGTGGFITESGKIKVSITYTNIKEAIDNPLSDKLLWLQRDNNGYGVVTIGGRNQTSFNHLRENITLFKFVAKEYIKLQTGEGENVFDLANKKYLFDDGQYSSVDIHEDSHTLICKDFENKYSIINENSSGDIKFDSVNKLAKGVYQVMIDKKIGLVDSKGNTLVDLIYERVLFVNDNIITFKNNTIVESFSFSGELLGGKHE